MPPKGGWARIRHGLARAFVKISIIVPAYNEEKLLPLTLRSIQEAARAFAALGWEMELIVCDNNSTDATARLAAEARARVEAHPVVQEAVRLFGAQLRDVKLPTGEA